MKIILQKLRQSLNGKLSHPKRFSTSLIALLLVSVMATVDTYAGSLERAKRIHDRLAGVPPSETVLLNMAQDITDGNVMAAANRAMDNEAFYSVTLKNWMAPATNRDQDVFVPLNDYIATAIGLVRDEEDFRELLHADVIYIGDPALSIPAYSNSNNDHYEALEDGGISLKDNLVRRSQTSVTGLPAGAAAGVMTSRAAAKAFLILGTNRANFRFTLLNHLCVDMEQVHDITRIPDRIRQDVSRSPGGDSRVFLNNCVGCHSGMDPLTQAFAYYDYVFDIDNDPDGENGAIDYNDVNDVDPVSGTRVKAKYFNNDATFPFGFVTPDDQWSNYWRAGVNTSLGWDTNDLDLPASGTGASSMGRELANSEAFAQCQVKKVFRTVCLRDPINTNDITQVNSMVTSLKAGESYNLKNTFAQAADYCSSNL